MNFGKAIEALKEGKCVRRTMWNNGCQFITKQVPITLGEDIIPKMTSLSDAAKKQVFNSFKDENKQIDTITYNDQVIVFKASNLIDSYIPSTEDLFAEDWVIVK